MWLGFYCLWRLLTSALVYCFNGVDQDAFSTAVHEQVDFCRKQPRIASRAAKLHMSPDSAFSVQTVNLMKKEKRQEGKKKISLEKQSFSQKEISAADFFCTRVEWKRKIDSPECQVLPYDETKWVCDGGVRWVWVMAWCVSVYLCTALFNEDNKMNESGEEGEKENPSRINFSGS